MNYEKHLYVILHPNPSLVASMYKPKQFAMHYISGSTRFYDGRVLFFEISLDYRNDWFNIEEALNELKPHEDGRPKATKFIKSYRIIEHIDFSAIKNLYITTPTGECLELEADKSEKDIDVKEDGELRIFAEINPLSMLVITKLNYINFGKNITDPNDSKSAPKQCYTQIHFDADQFLSDFEKNPMMLPPLRGVHPSKLRDAILEMKINPYKKTKGLALDSNFNKIPYSYIKHGFMFASETESKFFRIPSMLEIEKKNFKFWRSMI